MSCLRFSTTKTLWSFSVCILYRSDDVSFQFILVEAAFEVYIRRAYRAYSLLSIDYEEGDGLDDGEVPNVIIWRFNLGQSHTPPLTPRTE